MFWEGLITAGIVFSGNVFSIFIFFQDENLIGIAGIWW